MGWSSGTMSVVTNSSKCAIYGLEAHTKAATITTKPKLERRERSSKNSLQNKAFGEFLPKSPTPKASVSPELPRTNLPATSPCSPARLLFQPPPLPPAHSRAPLQNRQLVGLCGPQPGVRRCCSPSRWVPKQDVLPQSTGRCRKETVTPCLLPCSASL